MKSRIAKLISVKSIMTLMLTVVFCALALKNVISGSEFLTIFTAIVGFYFGTQSERKASDTPEPDIKETELSAAIQKMYDLQTASADTAKKSRLSDDA